MADAQTNGMPTGPIAGAAKYGAVGMLGFLAGAGTLWSVTTREPAPIATTQPPAPIIVQPPQVVINVPPQPAASPVDSGPIGPAGPVGPVPTTESAIPPTTVTPTPTPAPTPATGPAAGPATAPSRTARLNINTATSAQIELLPGIGPALAARIVAYRTSHGAFTSIADLDKVDGIGPKTLERLAPLISVE